jgi:hypothetical protein
MKGRLLASGPVPEAQGGAVLGAESAHCPQLAGAAFGEHRHHQFPQRPGQILLSRLRYILSGADLVNRLPRLRLVRRHPKASRGRHGPGGAACVPGPARRTQGPDTMLPGMADQAALYGALAWIEELGLDTKPGNTGVTLRSCPRWGDC